MLREAMTRPTFGQCGEGAGCGRPVRPYLDVTTAESLAHWQAEGNASSYRPTVTALDAITVMCNKSHQRINRFYNKPTNILPQHLTIGLYSTLYMQKSKAHYSNTLQLQIRERDNQINDSMCTVCQYN